MTVTWLLAGLLISFIVTWLSGYFYIPVLHRLKFGQPIKEIGPTWHASKKGTPTMGGAMFITGIITAAAAVMLLTGGAADGFGNEVFVGGVNKRLVIGLMMAISFGMCGFIDDYAKVKKKRNTGLERSQKLVFQVLIAAAFLSSLYISGDRSSLVWIPFADYIDLGLAYYPIMAFIIVGTVNAVNIHDGIDGLCSSTMAVASCCFIVIASLGGVFGAQLAGAVTAGGCIGFLMWNKNPAKIFMGDLGSHFLGGMLVMMSFLVNKPLLLLPVGLIYMLETLSDIIQGISYKLTGKRVFKMSPVHHHYEMCGWSENKIVAVFSAVAAAGGAVGIALVYFG